MSVVDDIKARLDIVEVVEGYVPLRRTGRALKANCPFHTERTPSFTVSPERQSWHCFGACATGGDIFNFVMRAENLDFGDALRLLARRAGVEIGQSQGRDQSNVLYRINRAAAGYYQQVLDSDPGKLGRDYLDERRVGTGARETFKLGLSPDRWDGLLRYLEAHGHKVEDAVAAGLVRQSDDGRTWDFFRNRLMFPIFSRDGEIAGFGARALDDTNPKYMNTPRTDVFDKQSTLYALNFAAPAIRESGSAVIVEGYMDAIAAHEHGYLNVVASMGTALTENQVGLLRTSAQDFVLALDPDAAGQEAMLRSLESSWRVFRSVVTRRGQSTQTVLSEVRPYNLRVAALPAGLDPDDLIRSDSQRWESTVSDAPTLLDFVIPALVGRTDLSVPDSRTRIALELSRLINRLDDNDQYSYWEKLSDALGVPLDVLRAAVAGARSQTSRRRGTREQSSFRQESEVSSSILNTGIREPREEYALWLLLRRPELIAEVSEVNPDTFRSTENRELFTALVGSPTIEGLRGELDPVLADHLDRLETTEREDRAATDRYRDEAALAECVKWLRLRHLKELQSAYLQTGELGEPPSRELEEPITRVNEQIRELESMVTRPRY